MSSGFVYWLLMLLSFLFGFYAWAPEFRSGRYGILGGNVLLFILLFLLGWKVFGWPIQG